MEQDVIYLFINHKKEEIEPVHTHIHARIGKMGQSCFPVPSLSIGGNYA